MESQCNLTGNQIFYWCCPSCGEVFWQTQTSISNYTHYCQVIGGMVCCPPPWPKKENEKIQEGHTDKKPEITIPECNIDWSQYPYLSYLGGDSDQKEE